MATEQNLGHEPQIPFELNQRQSAGHRSFTSAVPVSEPVTPPTTKHPPSFYPQHRYTGFNPSSLDGTPQFSPSLMNRDPAAAPLSHSSSKTYMASPTDLNLAKSYPPPPTASYLATPNTPKQARPNTQAFTSTPIGSLNLNSRNSFPAPHSAANAAALPSSQPHSSQSHPSQHRPPLTASAGPAPGSTPIGHARSYSYNVVDPQGGLKRLSLSSQTAKPGATSPEYLRPRAYSLGLHQMNGAMNSAAMNSSGINGAVMNNQFNVALDLNVHAFPAPLSSPISPDNLICSGNMTPRLRSFNHAFTPTNQTEDQFATSNLYRSLSTASLKTPTTPMQRLSLPESLMPSVSGIGLPPLSAGASTASDLPTATMPSTRATNSFTNRPYHSRRSSSSGSSVDGSGLAAIGSMTPLSASSNAGKDLPAPTGPHVDLESCTDTEIHALCRDQRGCRFLQRKLLESSPETIRRIFRVTSPHIVTLMVDAFGNYFCQKLFELCNEAEILTLLMISSESLPGIANNQHGTRALQRLIDVLSTAEHQRIIVESLDGHVVRLIRDINGNHVIQKLLLTLDEAGSQFIYDAVCESVVEIGSHRHGCCVLQRCLDYAKEKNRQKLVSHIVAQAPILVCDPFGNYVCQYVIDLGNQEFTDLLVRQLRGRIAKLSIQKFSSNVVEKCLRSASPPLQRELVAELMEPVTLNELLLDNYGNYVIQTALECMSNSDPSAKQTLSRDICNALTVTRSPYGRRIMSKLKSW